MMLWLEDGTGACFEIEFRTTQDAIDLALRTQKYALPVDRVRRIRTSENHIIWMAP